jgi:putative DNA primase/helicase
MSELALKAKGRWRSILPALGVSSDFLSGRHGPCPVCGGSDRFRFDDKDQRGTFYCNACGAGDGFKLLQLVHGWDFARTAKEVEGQVGAAPVETAKDRVDPAVVRKSMNNLWRAAHPLDHVYACRLWWINRVGIVPQCADLRGVDELFHPPSKRRFPGMIALVRDASGAVCNMHRTWLTSAGAKAPVERNRMVMPLELPSGAAIRLSDAAPRMGVATGLETAVAASLLFDRPVWATMTDVMLRKWAPPAGTAHLAIYGDSDASYSGQAAAYDLARSLASKRQPLAVELPATIGEDWNDVWRQTGAYQEHLAYAQAANTNTPSRGAAA